MLNPKDVTAFSEQIGAQFKELEGIVIWDIARRLKSDINGVGFTLTGDIQMGFMKDLGYSPKELRRLIADTLKVAAEDVDTKIYGFGMQAYQDDREHYAKVGLKLPPISENGFVQNLINDSKNQVKGEILNLSNTVGFADKNGKFYGIDDYYKRTLDKAVFQTSSGLFDIQSVTRRFVKEMAENGVTVVNFESGVKRNMESHIKTNILTGISQMAGRIALRNAEEMNVDLMEITAHAGARPSHSVWQGKIVSRSGKPGYLSLNDIGYGDVSGFQGANCLHGWFPYWEGVSEPKYDPEDLEELNDQSKKYKYDGKEYTEYEAKQRMRQIERSISKTKRQLIGLDAAQDKEMFTSKSILLKRQRELYDDFAKSAKQKKQDWRTQVYNFDRKKAAQANAAYRKGVKE